MRPICPVMMHIPVRYLVRLLRLFVSILSVFLWWLPSIRSVCACLLEFHLVMSCLCPGYDMVMSDPSYDVGILVYDPSKYL